MGLKHVRAPGSVASNDVAVPSNTSLQRTAKSVTAFGCAKAAPPSGAADRRRYVSLCSARIAC